jgi:hypothetical protein
MPRSQSPRSASLFPRRLCRLTSSQRITARTTRNAKPDHLDTEPTSNPTL